MIYSLKAADFAEWRAQARHLLSHDINPSNVSWQNAEQITLFASLPPAKPGTFSFQVSADFLSFAQTIACHRSRERWDLLYRLLYRLTHGEKHLLHMTTDPLIHTLHGMEKAIRRDAHKMKAFVRFRKTEDDDGEHFIAWHEPDHFIVRRVAPFFARRFAAMRWSILTPDDSVHWDGEALHYLPGTDKSHAPDDDTLENLWRTYYRSTFNPARIKINMMKREMPVRYWKNLPETEIISDMLEEAPDRVQAMIQFSEGSVTSAAEFLPDIQDLAHLRAAAKNCQGCELHKPATQTVFGEGAAKARIMFVGEQPGNEEDARGQPFVGPAGVLLMEALNHAQIKREDVYITNAIKHFRFTMRGDFRLHQSPLRQHVHACKPWLVAEIAAVQPEIIICLGNTAARALLGAGFTLKTGRGIWHEEKPPVMATYHPSAILRMQGREQQALKAMLFEDIHMAASRVSEKILA